MIGESAGESMTIRHIRIFEAVCDCDCNTTRAAEKLHMTQPAVSLAISELENYYGVKLFDRISRRLSISEAGKKFLSYARNISLAFSDMEKTIRNWDDRGAISAGASVSIGAQLMPTLASRFARTNPGTELRVRIDRSDRLEEALQNNALDFALIEGIIHNPNLVSEDFMEDSLAVVASRNGKYRNGDAISIEEFLSQKFLLREHGSGTREQFDNTLSAMGYLPPEPVWESLSTAALLNAAGMGLGIAVVPERMARDKVNDGSVCAIRVEGLEFRRKYKIVYHRNKCITRGICDFLELCRQYGKNGRG